MTKRDNQSTQRHGVLSQMPHPESTVRQDVKPGSPHVDCIRIPTQVGHPCYPSVVLPAVDVDRLSGFPQVDVYTRDAVAAFSVPRVSRETVWSL